VRSSLAEDLRQKTPDPRIMVRFPNWIGDAVMALPGLEALRRSVPGGLLVVLAKPWVADVIRMSPSADAVMEYLDPGEHSGMKGKYRLAGELRKEKFDCAVLFQNAFEAALIARLARISLLGGYDTDMRRILLTHPVTRPNKKGGEGHQVGYYMDLVRSLGFSAEVDLASRLVPKPAVGFEKRTVVLAPGASYGPAKMWPSIRYVQLGKRLSEMGYSIVVMGSEAESTVCSLVAEGIGESATDLSGRTSLSEAGGILAASQLVVSNDSGLMHLTAAVGANVVALFGSTDPDATGPFSESAVVIRGKAPCAPCFLRDCPSELECFDDVTVDVVLAECDRILEGSG